MRQIEQRGGVLGVVPDSAVVVADTGQVYLSGVGRDGRPVKPDTFAPVNQGQTLGRR